MSLQLVANHLAQKGRGPDSTLVHMSNREVAGLQALAQKHGGNLSVNPDTGLPEAGFLDNLLPTIAGAGISYFSGGAIDPITAGAIVGGITALDSKDLSKGLMAGLGAYGGAGMVGGLAGLGAAGADTAAMAAPEYQAAVGTGAGNFASHPIDSLSTLGGGSVIKGSLPILAGLAPAAAEAFDEEEGDEAPAQHKGYIRKYALDPVTGQYKQVGAYEAGGDPNVDVSSKAGTAGAFGGVGQSEYEAAQGMAAGGKATDSERIYDYLMGRGENPMQFTSASRPRVDYSIPKPPEPITPTTPILDPQYDQYGNRVSGGGRGEREPEDPNSFSAQWAAMDDAEKEAWRAENPKSAIAQDVVTLLGSPLKFLYDKAQAYMGPYSSTGGPARYSAPPVTPDVAADVFGGYPVDFSPNPYNMGPGTPGFNPMPTGPTQGAFIPGTPDTPEVQNVINNTDFSGMDRGSTPNAPSTPDTQAVQNAINNTDFSGMDRGGGRASSGDNNGGGVNPGGYSNSMTRSGDNAGGSMAAHGGYLQHGQFDQRMARGGLPAPGAFYRKGKYNYKGPQVYADGGGIADLEGHYNLGGYSDGGRLLKGPGDGVSDDIPATIGHGQPARLADGEFVIPARIVSEIGNGSTDAGARELYKMMDRIQAGRAKTVGKDQVAKNSKSVRHLPA